MAKRVLFFGCIERAGHFLWAQQGSVVMPSKHSMGEAGPWRHYPKPGEHGLDPVKGPDLSAWKIDEKQQEGRAVLSHCSGWTRLGWADRSVDHRHGSHANIIAEGIRSFEEMLALGRECFPDVMKRMKYDIVLERTVELDEDAREARRMKP